MDTSLYESDDKIQRRRVIAITILIGLIVLAVAAWAVVAIIDSNQDLRDTTNTTEVATDDGATKDSTITLEESSKEAPVSEGVSTEATKKQNDAGQTAAEVPATRTGKTENDRKDQATQSSVPETGPEELLPLALVAGITVTYISSRRFAKRA